MACGERNRHQRQNQSPISAKAPAFADRLGARLESFALIGNGPNEARESACANGREAAVGG